MKWIEMQQQFDSLMATAKGAQNAPQTQQQLEPNQGQRNNNQNNNNMNNNGQRPHKHNGNQNNAAYNSQAIRHL